MALKRRTFALLLFAGACAAIPGTLAGQGAGSPALFPDRRLLPVLLAGSREPVAKAQAVYADPDPTAYGPGLSGEVALAGTIAAIRLVGADSTDALVAGVEAGAFARFSLQVVTRELVNTDWVFAVPVVWRRGRHWVRLRYLHTSSHLGDEYQRRFGPSSINFFRDGVDLTAYVRPAGIGPAGLGIYGLFFWVVNADPETAAFWAGRLGAELDPARGRPWRPYGAVDVELGEDLDGTRWTAQAGLWLPGPERGPLRLAVEWLAGPSPLGQFHDRDTRRVGLGLYWNP